jgi:hypothetical protein
MKTDDLIKIEQYRRFLRPDWRRWLPPDPERGLTREQIKAQRHDLMLRDRAFETPLARRLRKEREEREREEQEALEAEHREEIERDALAMKAELASLRVELVWAELRWKAECAESKRRADIAWERFKAAFMRGDFAPRGKANFNPNQPRVPTGSPDGGQWTGGDGSAGSSQGEPVQLDEISAARRGRGHHYVTRELFEKLEKEGLPTETLNVFEDATTGRLTDPRSNKNDAEHRLYNKAVDEQWQRFKERNNVKVDQMSADQARTFVEEIKNSNDPRIREFNRKIWLREILRGGRLGGRGNE